MNSKFDDHGNDNKADGNDKTKLRQLAQENITNFLKESPSAQEKLTGHLLRFLQDQSRYWGAGYWGTYVATAHEASPLFAVDQTPQIKWCYPRVEGRDLAFYHNPSREGFLQGRFGIFEPNPECSKKIEAEQLLGCLMPGVLFDASGARLGKGMGFYDRALRQFKGVKAGVAFSAQIFNDDLPMEDHDVYVDYIITDAGVTTCMDRHKM